MTQEVVRRQMAEIFDRFPVLAGLTLRFGETVHWDTPYHGGGRPMPFSGEGHDKAISPCSNCFARKCASNETK